MSRTIVEMFYSHGGYESDSAYADQDNYISLDHCTGTYMPQAVLRLNSLCETTVSVNYTSLSTGDLMNDVIVAELALSIADSEYDKLHVDPLTFQVENKHWLAAKTYMLDMYGVSRKGDLYLPREVNGTKAHDEIEAAVVVTD